MENAIIIVIILLVIAFGLKETVKHFRGEGACCGGSSSKIKKKKLNNKVVQRYVLKVDGMHCKHCVNTVTEIINDFEGAAGRVDLRKGEAVVLCDRDVDIEKIKDKLQKRGYDINVLEGITSE